MIIERLDDSELLHTLAVYKKHGSQRKAAEELGLSKTGLQHRLKNAHKRGLSNRPGPQAPEGYEITKFTERYDKHGAYAGHTTKYDQEHGEIFKLKDGRKVGKITSNVDADGRVIQEWIRHDNDKDIDPTEVLREAIEALKEDIPKVSPTPPPLATASDICSTYILTDYHLGLMAWSEETRGDDWDAKIAEEMIIKWFSTLIGRSPDSEVAVLAQLGDFLHFDGMNAVTPTSHNLLDTDSRFQKIVRIAIRVLRVIISMLLTKHKKVYIYNVAGNHDMASGVWLREFLSVLYEDEPRVTVDLTADLFHAFEFGDVSLFFHHGHKKGVAKVSDVFTSKFRDIYGRTKYSYAHIGHFHHKDIKEDNLMICEGHRTMAAPDAHAATSGYCSGREANMIIYHKKYGEVGRSTITPEMIMPS